MYTIDILFVGDNHLMGQHAAQAIGETLELAMVVVTLLHQKEEG
jgi:hypothetical protein